MKQKFANALSLALIVAMLFTSVVLASDVDVAVVDVTVPTNSVTLAPGGNGNITINMSVSGAQAGTATFEVYRDWTLSGGTFTGSNPQEFTVGPRSGGDPAATFSTSGTVSIAAGQTAGTFTLAVGVFDITNSNATGAKLAAGDPSNYQVTVSAPPPPSDTTAPVITPNISGTLGNNGWYTSDVTVSWSVVDNESTVSSTSGCETTTINADTAGTTLTCSATSAGGTDSESVTIKRDATAPTISGSASPAPNGAGWNNSDVAVTFSCDDNLSGVVSCGPNATLSSEGAGQSVSGTVVDAAGNEASTSVSPISIDKTAPTISASINPVAAGTGWYNSTTGAPTVSFTCNDTGGSGLAGSCPSAVTLGEGADQSVSGGPVSDVAGNPSNVATLSNIDVDLTAPEVSLVGGPANGQSYYFGSVPAAPTCSASDALSGLNGTCAVTGYGTAVGPHTVTATAVDNAGNSASTSVTYTVLAWTLNGFYQPVDMGGVYNTVRGGSTVPLKFELFAGSTELTNTTAITSLNAARVACTPGGTEDQIELTATGGTSLRYDSVAGQFIYNWKTPTGTNTCYKVTMTAADGSTLVAFFKLK